MIAAVLRLRLIEAGWGAGRRGGAGAAGSSDASARGQVHLAARQLESLIGGRVRSASSPLLNRRCRKAISRARRRLRRGGKLVVASYLLAPGLFHSRLFSMDVGAVAEPSVPTPHLRPHRHPHARRRQPLPPPAAVTWR